MPEGGVGHYVGAGQIARSDHAECDAQVAGIVAYHEAKGYKRGGAYNEHACQHGGRWLHYLGPNQATGNTWANLNLHAVCAVIGDGDIPTPALLTAMRAAWDEAGAGQWITPHSHWFNTSCCGDPLRGWIAAGAPASARTPRIVEVPRMFIAVTRTIFGVAIAALLGPTGKVRDFPGVEGVYGIPQSAIDWKEGPGRDAVPYVFVEWGDYAALTAAVASQPSTTITPDQVEAIVVATLNKTKLGVG